MTNTDRSETCEDGMCWAEPLGEACDHWKAETERLRAEVDRLRQQVLALENAGLETAAQLGEAEAHLWALVVWFGGKYEHPYINRDVAAAARYVERYLADEDMTARHRKVTHVA